MASLSEVARLCHDFPAISIVCNHRLADEEMWAATLNAGAADCCPSHDTRDIVRAALRHAHFDLTLSIQNGPLKNELLAQAFGSERVLGALADTSGELLPGGEVLKAGDQGEPQAGAASHSPEAGYRDRFQEEGSLRSRAARAGSRQFRLRACQRGGQLLVACVSRQHQPGRLCRYVVAGQLVEDEIQKRFLIRHEGPLRSLQRTTVRQLATS